VFSIQLNPYANLTITVEIARSSFQSQNDKNRSIPSLKWAGVGCNGKLKRGGGDIIEKRV